MPRLRMRSRRWRDGARLDRILRAVRYHGAGQAMRRRIIIVAIFLLAGAVVNVAVAWGCAMWSSPGPEPQPTLGKRPTVDEGLWWKGLAPEGAARRAEYASRLHGLGIDVITLTGRRELSRDGRGGIRYAADRATTVRCGWPFRSTVGVRWDIGPYAMLFNRGVTTTSRAADALDGAFRFNRPAWLGGNSLRLFPLRPVWLGFAVNTILYAAILWLLICGPFVLRRFIRVKRGRCPACAYPTGQSDTCSECGKPLPGRTVTA